MKFRKYTVTQVAEPDLPVVSGCTESLALVKSVMSFRGPPWTRCCRWYFFSSDKGIKRFIILWYWTSTWETHIKKNSAACSNVTAGMSFGLPCSIWGCLVYCWHQSGRLSYQTVCGPHTLPSQSRYKTTSGVTLVHLSQSQHQQDRRWTCLHESCYPWILAVAVVEEGHLPLLHLPHKITGLWSEVTRSAVDQDIKTREGRFGMFRLDGPTWKFRTPSQQLVWSDIAFRSSIANWKVNQSREPAATLWSRTRARCNIPSCRCRSRSGSRARTSSASGCAVEARLLAP